MKWDKLIFTILILLGVGYFYKNFKTKMNIDDGKQDLNLIKKYLLGESDINSIKDLENIKKPIIWIHIDYNYNSRNWCSFGSRSSMELNMPYIYLTIQSIINNCGNDFHICLIDDYTFNKIIPDYNVDLTKLSDPIKKHLRNLALMKLLYIYGGVLMENSFICLKSIKPLYDNVIETNSPMVGEFINESNSNDLEVYMPSTKLIGCVKECPLIQTFIEYLETLNNNDFTSEQDFTGDVGFWLLNNIKRKNIQLISAELIYTRENNNLVTIDKLLTNDELNIPNECIMIYIPRDEILKRIKYSWVARMSPEEILTSNTNLGKYLLISNS